MSSVINYLKEHKAYIPLAISSTIGYLNLSKCGPSELHYFYMDCCSGKMVEVFEKSTSSFFGYSDCSDLNRHVVILSITCGLLASEMIKGLFPRNRIQ